MRQQMLLDVSQAADVGTFQDRLVDLGAALGFELVNSFLVLERDGRGPEVRYVGNRPLAFTSISIDPELIRRDPVLKRLRRQSVPFAYDQATYVEAEAADIWDLSAPYGYHTGISVAAHLPGRRHFVLSLSRRKALPRSDVHLTRMLADLQLLSAHGQEAALRMLSDATDSSEAGGDICDPAKTADQIRPRMTRRELEVLRWIRDGKTDDEIAQILDLSKSTVRMHLASAARKLDTRGKLPTALAAMRLGLIS